MKMAGLLVALVGPAGVGKNQLMKHVMANSPITQLPTATTRAIRDGEQEGREHFFVTRDEFLKLIADDQMLEYQEVHRRFYGMVRRVVENAFAHGQPIIADIDIYGAMTIRQRYPEQTVSVFIQPPSIGSLIDRMRARGDREAEISKRLLRVPLELDLASNCDYIVINDEFAQAAHGLLEIVQAEIAGTPERPASVSAQLAHPYQYVARVIPLRGDQVLCSDGSFPTAVIGKDDQPFERALFALRNQLGIEPSLERLIHAELPHDKYVPPLSLDYELAETGEVITFNYLYRLEDTATLPQRWQWEPVHQQTNLDFVKGLVG